MPRFARELLQGLRAMDCHELAAELEAMRVERWIHDPATGAVSVQLLGAHAECADADLVPTGFGRSIPLRLPGTVLLELDAFGRIHALEIFGRDDVLDELRASAP